ncbi:MAG: hypothetical protein JRD93_14720 [Deltaproteobacteria bacterium]|nr:hypothetical protein [Deltaproteobacteria bacterium]
MRVKRRWHSFALGTIAVLCLLFQMGCSLTENQRKNAANFSSATTVLAEVTSNELVQMRNETIMMNTYRLAAVGEEAGQAKLNDLDQKFDVENVKVRIQAVEVLKTYGKLLESLVKETQDEELKDASQNFVASINGLPTGDRKLDAKQSEALGQLVYQMGGMIVEAKKAKAVKDIVGTTKEQIGHLCDLLSKEFDLSAANLLTQYKSTGDLAIAAVKRSFSASNNDHKEVLTRLELVEIYKKIQANRDRVDSIAANLKIAITNMKSANETLNDSLLEKEGISINNIKDYSKSVKEIIDLIKVLGQDENE